MSSIRNIVAGSFLVLSVITAIAAVWPAASFAQEAAVTARDAWVRVPAPSKDETALYVTIENKSADKRAVVSVTSEQAKTAEMHQMSMDGRLMKMTQVSQIVVPAKGKAELRPNGLHIMLMGLTTRPAVGDTLNVTLKLDDGTTMPLTAQVRK